MYLSPGGPGSFALKPAAAPAGMPDTCEKMWRERGVRCWLCSACWRGKAAAEKGAPYEIEQSTKGS